MRTTVTPGKLRHAATDMQSVQKSLNGINGEVSRIASTLRTSISSRSYEEISRHLHSYGGELKNISEKVSRMRTGLTEVVVAYERTDREVASYKGGVGGIGWRSGGGIGGGSWGNGGYTVSPVDAWNKLYDFSGDVSKVLNVLFPGSAIIPGIIGVIGPIRPNSNIDIFHTSTKTEGGTTTNEASVFHKEDSSKGHTSKVDGLYAKEEHGFKIYTKGEQSLKEGEDPKDTENLGVKGEFGVEAGLLRRKDDWDSGILHGDSEFKVGAVGASAAIGATLFKNGKLDPSFNAEAKAEAVGIEEKLGGRVGNKDNNIHGEAKGQVGYAGAKASAGVSKDGVKASAEAEAYALQGEVKGGLNILGIKIDIGIEGKAFGAGASAEFEAGKTSTKGEVALGFVAGAGLKWDIDWSGFKNPFDNNKQVSSGSGGRGASGGGGSGGGGGGR